MQTKRLGQSLLSAHLFGSGVLPSAGDPSETGLLPSFTDETSYASTPRIFPQPTHVRPSTPAARARVRSRREFGLAVIGVPVDRGRSKRGSRKSLQVWTERAH